MQPSDLESVLAIEQSNFSHPWTLGNFKDSLHAGHSCWVMLNGHDIVGYGILMMVLDEVHVLDFSIAQAHQRKGLGRQLLHHLSTVGREHGGNMMFLEVRISNTAAIALYEQAGFNEMSIRRNYYPAAKGREDAVLMGMAL